MLMSMNTDTVIAPRILREEVVWDAFKDEERKKWTAPLALRTRTEKSYDLLMNIDPVSLLFANLIHAWGSYHLFPLSIPIPSQVCQKENVICVDRSFTRVWKCSIPWVSHLFPLSIPFPRCAVRMSGSSINSLPCDVRKNIFCGQSHKSQSPWRTVFVTSAQSL